MSTPAERKAGWAPQATSESVRADVEAGTRCAGCRMAFVERDELVETPDGLMHRSPCATTRGYAEPAAKVAAGFSKQDLFG